MPIMKSLRLILIVGWVYLSPLLLFAQKSIPPAEVVRAFCKLDFEGARLEAANYPKIAKLYSWKGEPGWDTALIVKSFRVKPVANNGNTASVIVEYTQYGELAGEEFHLKEGANAARFKLKKISGSWRIIAPVIPPHVSVSAIRQHIEALVRDEGQESAARWSKTLNELRSLNQQ